jgi:hypothetical protein
MNEDCWLGKKPGLNPKHTGENYQSAFKNFTTLLRSNGMVVVLDLHWTNTTSGIAHGQDLMLSNSSLEFWADVASREEYKNIPGVVFELFNEPHGFKYSPNLPPSCFLDGQGCVEKETESFDASAAPTSTFLHALQVIQRF